MGAKGVDFGVPCNCHPETCCCGGWEPARFPEEVTSLPKPMTEEEYKELTRVSDYRLKYDEFKILFIFTFEEVQNFLTKKGYTLTKHEGSAKVQDQQSDGVEVRPVGAPYYKKFTQIFATKPKDFPLNDVLDTPEMVNMLVPVVFQREFKQALLNIL